MGRLASWSYRLRRGSEAAAAVPLPSRMASAKGKPRTTIISIDTGSQGRAARRLRIILNGNGGAEEESLLGGMHMFSVVRRSPTFYFSNDNFGIIITQLPGSRRNVPLYTYTVVVRSRTNIQYRTVCSLRCGIHLFTKSNSQECQTRAIVSNQQ